MSDQVKHRRCYFTPEIDENVENRRLLIVIGRIVARHELQVYRP